MQNYAEDLSMFPPIEINQHDELIDGWHRWTAHKKNGAEDIRAIVTETTSDAHLRELAIERNVKNGLLFSQEDRRSNARKIYSATPMAEQGRMKKRLAELYNVDISTVQNWLSRIDKDNKEERDCTVRDLWMACYSQEEVAEAVGMRQPSILEILSETAVSVSL